MFTEIFHEEKNTGWKTVADGYFIEWSMFELYD